MRNLCVRLCEWAAKDVSFFHPSVTTVISYGKQLLAFIATGLVLSTLISPVVRFGDALEQFNSQWGSYLHKICLHIFLDVAEGGCGGSGHYQLLDVIHKRENKARSGQSGRLFQGHAHLPVGDVTL